MERGWLGLPFRPISEFYKERFGGKVYKIPVATADACPNRLGLRGMKTCSFCDVWGSAARAEALDLDLQTQLEKYSQTIGKRFNAAQFLVYFQAYTSTFTALHRVKAQYDLALSYPGVCGLVVGTRPDCLSAGVLNEWKAYSEKTYLSIELGLQSFDEEQLVFLRRGHTAEDSITAIEKIAALNAPIDIGIHLMFGLPGESLESIRQTAEACNRLNIQNVKLHNLHVLKGTELELQFNRGEFVPIEREAYAERVQVFLEHLNPQIYVHRLAAFSSRFHELIAPKWTSDKMGSHQFVVDHIRSNQGYQGRYFQTTDLHLLKKKEELAIRSLPLVHSLSNCSV